ncbi:YopX family protein [Bacillus velezensis]|uniref:YopX family protein n=1 Tax=Bacillus velezensis TaxID=492670 RepID=UPI002DB7BEF4|nr:YopX family protein [Bacillus velezensis]MEC1395329.1 YopX family protein [Bacillus velezensis]
MNAIYRVWDGEQMHHWDDEGLSLEIKGDKWILWRDGCRIIVAESYDGKSVLMWGIGLKDRNEKMIYEYDIDMVNNEPMIVARAGGNFGLRFPSDCDYHIDAWIVWGERDIGGNVYQNPELLEGAECQE